MNLIIRHDDFDFRLPTEVYISNHQKFIDAGLIETAVIQLTQHGHIPEYGQIPELFEYMKTAPNWDIQLHGWSHEMYGEKAHGDIYRDLAASMHIMKKLFGKEPTVWYPPWNNTSPEMEKVASSFGLRVDAESCDIGQFIRKSRDGSFDGHVVYYHLWNKDEAAQIDDMLKFAQEYANR